MSLTKIIFLGIGFLNVPSAIVNFSFGHFWLGVIASCCALYFLFIGFNLED
ncbi:MAG: hypothetical protein R3321_05180 [Nitrososphaeraceae archaeon]|nr:hypothetical protein [Nitrososphaeraceae archaeon]